MNAVYILPSFANAKLVNISPTEFPILNNNPVIITSSPSIIKARKLVASTNPEQTRDK